MADPMFLKFLFYLGIILFIILLGLAITNIALKNKNV